MKVRHIWLLAFSILAFSCSDDDTNVNPSDSNDDLPEVTGRDLTIRSGDIDYIHLKDVPARIEIDEGIAEGEVRVTSDEDLDNKLTYYIENSELHLEGDGSGDVVVYTNPGNIRKLVIRGNEDVYFDGSPELDRLEIETEGNSTLRIDKMRIRNLVTRLNGNSEMYLSGLLDDFARDTIILERDDIVELEDDYLIYTEDGAEYFLHFPDIDVVGDSITVYANEEEDLTTYYLAQTHEIRLNGTALLDAFELPTLRVESRVNGNAEVNVWVLDFLQVRGNGNTVLRYLGNPITELELNGQAQVTKVDE